MIHPLKSSFFFYWTSPFYNAGRNRATCPSTVWAWFTRWWQLKRFFFQFSPLKIGEDSHFHEYFSVGLKPDSPRFHSLKHCTPRSAKAVAFDWWTCCSQTCRRSRILWQRKPQGSKGNPWKSSQNELTIHVYEKHDFIYLIYPDSSPFVKVFAFSWTGIAALKGGKLSERLWYRKYKTMWVTYILHTHRYYRCWFLPTTWERGTTQCLFKFVNPFFSVIIP